MTEWITVSVFVVGVVYTAGKIISGSRAEIRQLRNDLNGLGRKVRRQHTVDMLLIAMTNDRTERFRLVELLKED